MPWSQPGPSVSGRKIPDSSSSGTTIVLISGANASSLLTTRPVAYDTEASPMATNMMNTNPMPRLGSADAVQRDHEALIHQDLFEVRAPGATC
jgi:hypothetical protein